MFWHWFIFILILFLVPISIAGFKLFAEKHLNFNPTEEQKKIANQNMTKYMLFYWLCDIFYLTCFNNWLIMKFIIGILLMIIVFYSLTVSFLSSTSKNFILKFGFIQDFIVGIGLSIYLIYIIPCNEIKEIVIPIVSALYGGLLTLVGVAWTIKKADADRKKEKNEKVKPLIYAADPSFLDTNNLECLLFVNKGDNNNGRFIGTLKNTDNGLFIFKRILVNGMEYKPYKQFVLEKNCYVNLIINDENIGNKCVQLVGADIYNNEIKYRILFDEIGKYIESLIEEE